MARCRRCGLQIGRFEYCPRCGARNSANLNSWFSVRIIFISIVSFAIAGSIAGLVLFSHRQVTQAPLSSPPWMIADDAGQWAGTIRLDTLTFDSASRGSATVCHQSEYGSPSCNKWTFNCSYLRELAHSDYFPEFMQAPDTRHLTTGQNAELDALEAVAIKLPRTACQLR